MVLINPKQTGPEKLCLRGNEEGSVPLLCA